MVPCSKCGLPRVTGKPCKPCKRAYNHKYSQDHAAEISAQKARYYADHSVERLAYEAKHYSERRARKLAYNKKYWADSAVQQRALKKNHYAANAVELRARQNVYDAGHREEKAVRDKSYRKENLALIRSRNKQWRVKNFDKLRANNLARRARKAGAIGSHTKREFRAKCKAFDYCCIDCGMREGDKFKNGRVMKLTEGHAIPLTPKPGSGYGPGSDFIGNIIPQCGPCNSSQKNHFIHPSVLSASLFDRAAA